MKSLKERRQYYTELGRRGFTPEEIVHLMSDDEVEMNANKGGILAIKEKEKRDAIASPNPLPVDPDLDIGC